MGKGNRMDDLISREAVLALPIYNEKNLYGNIIREYVDIEDVKQLPPIQPKRGRWHYSDGKPARIGLSFGVVCDQCGTESEYCTNFCGECGADMRGEQDG